VLCNMEEVGIIVCHMLSSPTTIVFKGVSRWHPLRCFMDVDVELHCVGMRLENGRFLDPTYCKKSRSKFIWLGRTFESHNQDRKPMLIIGEEN
jgi:hypothetical protein